MRTAKMTCSQDEGHEKHPKLIALIAQGLRQRKRKMRVWDEDPAKQQNGGERIKRQDRV